MTAPRQLLHVGAESCPAGLAEHLHQREWVITNVRTMRAALPLLKQGRFKVAIAVFDEHSRDMAADFEACRDADDTCEWVAVLRPQALDSARTKELVLKHCFDHHTQPIDAQFLCQSLGHAFGRAVLRSGNTAADDDEQGMLGRSTPMAQLRRTLRKAATADASVLLEGETGSGKELAARYVHAASDRSPAPFVVVNGSAVANDAPRAFEEAAGGTLFLDHVAELPLDWQARLVRFMAECNVRRSKLGRGCPGDVRVIAASETPLADAVSAQRFRQDLYYRLNVVPIEVPPLRQRTDDIPLLAQHFHARFVRQSANGAKGFSRQAIAAMKEHDWPGNVRELENRVQRAVLLAERRLIGPEDLGLHDPSPQPLGSLEAIRVKAERHAIALSLDRFSHNVSLAARELGVSRMTMYRLMAKHEIEPRAA